MADCVFQAIDRLSAVDDGQTVRYNACMHSFRSIINSWPSRAVLAEDVGATLDAVEKWHQRDSIPANRDARLIASAPKYGIELSHELLADIRQAKSYGHIVRGQGAKPLKSARVKGECV